MATVKRDSPAKDRRTPKQDRARQTVVAILDAVMRILERGGTSAVNTNRIAEVAGVSIGSVYQYFPDKRAIFMALHERHVDRIGRVIDRTLVDHAESSLEDFVRALVSRLIEAHDEEPAFHQLMSSEVSHGPEGTRALELRLRGTFRLALGARKSGKTSRLDLEKMLFVLPHLVEALVHGAVHGRPEGLSLAQAKAESIRVILACLRSP